MKRHRVVLLGIFLVAACAPRLRTTLIGEPSSPDPERPAILVYSARVPDCPFEEIALVSATTQMPLTAMDDLLATLKERAWQLGGHAVVGLREGPRTKEEGPSLSATVVRFTNGCRPADGAGM